VWFENVSSILLHTIDSKIFSFPPTYYSAPLVNPGKVVDVPKDPEIIVNDWKKAADTTQNESSHESSWQLDDMVLLQCNIDDMTAEGIAHMMEAFISRHGARDVWVRYTHYLTSCIVCTYVVEVQLKCL
jgi:hypothetical protein